MSKNKHLTLDDRIEIQECLAKGMTFKAIANRIGKNQTTVSREVKAHAQSHSNGYTRTEEYCPKLLKAPFVCNGCEMKSRAKCPYIRRIYVAKTAQSSYEETLVESRSGIPLNKESFMKPSRLFQMQSNRDNMFTMLLKQIIFRFQPLLYTGILTSNIIPSEELIYLVP